MPNIVIRKPILAGCNKIFKQKVFLFYPRVAIVMLLQGAPNTGFFSVYTETYKIKQSHNNQSKCATTTIIEILQPKPHCYNCGKKDISKKPAPYHKIAKTRLTKRKTLLNREKLRAIKYGAHFLAWQ